MTNNDLEKLWEVMNGAGCDVKERKSIIRDLRMLEGTGFDLSGNVKFNHDVREPAEGYWGEKSETFPNLRVYVRRFLIGEKFQLKVWFEPNEEDGYIFLEYRVRMELERIGAGR